MNVKKIVVVGGGTAGLITALILKRKFNYTVDVVLSSKIGIIGVGEGSTEHFKEFMIYMGIDEKTILKECGATYKLGILFENWGDGDYVHTIQEPFNAKNGQYSYMYAKKISNRERILYPKNLSTNHLNKSLLTKYADVANQYHFDTHKLNNFLIKKCKELNINIFDDEIIDVFLNLNGEIEKITGEKQTYFYDFYVDSTGFKRVLHSKLGSSWKSFSSFLSMNSAIVFPSKDEDNYSVWTLAKAMDYGWRFKIPVQGRHGNGYIFDNNYISPTQAKEELDKCLGYDVQIAREFTFETGYIENPWVKNCVAVGLSASFVEPLEATSIGTSIQQAFMLIHKLANYTDKEISSYNKNFVSIMNNIRDFICLHYVNNEKKNEMWCNVSQREIPDSLKDKLEIWENRLPIQEDFNSDSNYILFNAQNFLVVLYGMGLMNVDNIRKEYQSTSNFIRQSADTIANLQKKYESSIELITHKEIVQAVVKYLN